MFRLFEIVFVFQLWYVAEPSAEKEAKVEDAAEKEEKPSEAAESADVEPEKKEGGEPETGTWADFYVLLIEGWGKGNNTPIFNTSTQVRVLESCIFQVIVFPYLNWEESHANVKLFIFIDNTNRLSWRK